MVDIQINKITKNDLPFLNEVRNECAEKYLHNSRKFSIEETISWFEETNPDYYIILLNEIKIGYFRTSDYNTNSKTIYIGCDLQKEYRNKNLGFLSYKKFISFVFNNYDVEEILLEVLETNIRAKKLYKNLGFKKIKNSEIKVMKESEYIFSELMSLKKQKISLSITTCKRLDTFKKTIKSFSEYCGDHYMISSIYHFDDSSSNEDREEMTLLLNEVFPNTEINRFYFDENSFITNKRHCHIMNKWLIILKNSCDYNFHLEDDWLFNTKFSLSELLNFIMTKNNVAYVGVSQFMRDFPKEITPVVEGNFWKWYYDKDKEILSNLFLDTKSMGIEGVEGYWCYYINWPYFGFRPGLWNVKKLTEIQEISCTNNINFELFFAKTLSEKYVSYCLLDSVCEHIGNNKSSYDLNNSER